jgi:parvulin-like peptidyl-prolyl isomerase
MRRLTPMLWLAVVIAGCETEWPYWPGSASSPGRGSAPVIAPEGGQPPPAAPQAAAPPPRAVVQTRPAPPTPPPATKAAPDPVLALVNGKPVPLTRVTDVLITAFGMPVAKDVIYLELVEQAAAAKGVGVTDAEAQAEHDRTLEERFGKMAARDQWESLFTQILTQHNISRRHWMLIARRNALLRKLAPKDIPVTAEETRDAYGKLYGRTVQVRHIERATMNDIQDVVGRLSKGADFAQLARDVSLSRDKEAGGLLPPFGAQTQDVPPALRQVAFSLKAVGAVSDPIQVNQSYHLLKLEKIIEPDVPYEKVKEEVAGLLRGEKVRVWGGRYLGQLTAAADVEFVEPALKAQYEQNLKALKEQEQEKARPPEEPRP